MKYNICCENKAASRGDVTRLKHLMARAFRGERLNIGFIGGSITQGSLATSPERCYAYLVYEWWRGNFPKSEFTYINAGIGGTTSQLGVARADEDLLSKEPDFVIIEFSVNDESTEHFLETYEGLVRKVYGAKTAPAVLLVHNVCYDTGANAQVMHAQIGRHYDLPSVSMQSTIYPEVVAGRIDRREITPDDLHPNDAGHELVASVITSFLEKIKCEAEAELKTNPEKNPAQINSGVSSDIDSDTDTKPLREALTENAYEVSVRYQNHNSTPVLDGFCADDAPQSDITDCFKRGWTAKKAGDSIRFSVKGTGIAVLYRKSVKKPAPVAEVTVDGAHTLRLDANFDEDWGDKLELDTVMEHGEYREHQVEIRITEAHGDDAVPFYLTAVIASGESV